MRELDFDLDRFLTAQDPVYEEVLRELRAGRKRGHWIWYIFPQLRGLGRSEMSRYYGIASLEEAVAYGRHSILGARLVECTELVNAIEGRSIHEIFPSPDDMKFRSSMTLFQRAVPEERAFERALKKYFGGELDGLTVRLLSSAG